MPSERVVAGLSCSEVLARLSDYVDGDVSAAEKRQIDAHLQGCDHCERFGGEFAGMVAALVERGYADRITLSHDASCHIDFMPAEVVERMRPTWNFGHISNVVIPMLRERGVSDEAIHQMTVGNPRHIFELNQPY